MTAIPIVSDDGLRRPIPSTPPAFGETFSDHMLVARYREGRWRDAEIRAYGPLSMPAAISGLQYGLSVFEGLKAFRSPSDNIALFRPRQNFERLGRSCRRLVLPEVPEHLFFDGIKQLVALDAAWVPEYEQGSLYVRPCVFATDENIRVRPAEAACFVVFTCPAGGYFAEPLNLVTTERYARAFPGGTGDIKPAGNYAAAMLAEAEARHAGYDGVLWLDAKERRFVEECGVMNVFFVIDAEVVTPPLSGTILAGVTRDSVITLLGDLGHRVVERPIAITELIEAHRAGTLTECFGTGTAATIAQVRQITHEGTVLELPSVRERKVASAVLTQLSLIRTGQLPDQHGWLTSL